MLLQWVKSSQTSCQIVCQTFNFCLSSPFFSLFCDPRFWPFFVSSLNSGCLRSFAQSKELKNALVRQHAAQPYASHMSKLLLTVAVCSCKLGPTESNSSVFGAWAWTASLILDSLLRGKPVESASGTCPNEPLSLSLHRYHMYYWQMDVSVSYCFTYVQTHNTPSVIGSLQCHFAVSLARVSCN